MVTFVDNKDLVTIREFWEAVSAMFHDLGADLILGKPLSYVFLFLCAQFSVCGIQCNIKGFKKYNVWCFQPSDAIPLLMFWNINSDSVVSSVSSSPDKRKLLLMFQTENLRKIISHKEF